jgi:TolB-like protein/lipoprotein NlpI
MGDESPKPASTPTGAVFLSYASQDAEAAKRVCDALRAAGVEVWFDQSELRGGDAWDQSIRKQIRTCALFLPVISKHTHERAEGYFRLEWKLAVDRSHLIMANKAFLVPVVIDDTADNDENVPEKFREVQWTRLPAGHTPPEFVTRIHQLMSGESGHSPTLARTSAPLSSGRLSRLKPAWLAVAVVVAALAAYLLADKPWTAKPAPPSKPAATTDIVAFNPPPHSIAVLPFVNMSGDKEQEYFSDGLTEELLNSLSRIHELQVAGRTSSFYFKGEHTDLSTIAHKLNVATVLEGSVRRSAHTVRITAQLINAGSGFHLWSQTYDRPFGDVLKLQTEIANAVASALKVSLLGDVTATTDVGGTRNPAAFDAYLRAAMAYRNGMRGANYVRAAISAYDEVLRLDPTYALAYADRALMHRYFAYEFARTKAAARASLDQALADAHQAIAIAPGLAEGHLALAEILEHEFSFSDASEEFERALALAPGSARILRTYSAFAVAMGHTEKGLVAGRRAVALDPLDFRTHHNLGYNLWWARRYGEALGEFDKTLSLNPGGNIAKMLRGATYYMLGDLDKAQMDLESTVDTPFALVWLARVYQKLGRHSEAEDTFAKYKRSMGDAGAYFSAQTQAEWGDPAGALESLEAALRLGDPYLEYLTIDPFFEPLRKEPRFQAIERELKFPN